MNRLHKLCAKYNLITYKEQRILRDIFLYIYIEGTWKDEDEVWTRAETELKEHLASKVAHDTSDSSDNSKES